MAVIDVRKGELVQLLVALLTCFGIITAHTMSETARDALFLTHLPASYLPLAYLGIGVTSFALGRLSKFLVERFGQRAGLVAIIALGAVMALVFRLSFAPHRDWLFYAYYVWVGTFATTSVVEFWLFASTIFTVAQGKRLFGLVGSGASFGTFLGATIAAVWARRLPIESLLIVVAGTLAATAVVPLFLPTAPQARRDHAQQALPMATLLKQRYLLHVAALVALSSLTLMLVDFQFKAAAAAAVPAARLAAFLGLVYGVLGATALVMQALSGTIVKRFGVAFALGLMPALLIVGGLALPMMSLLGRALALRSTDGTLRHSLHRVGMELLYMPLSPKTRTQVKALLDGSVGRFAQATASLVLIGLAAAGLTHLLLGILIVGFSAAWLVLAWKIRRPYIERFLSTIDGGTNGDLHVRFPDLEGASLTVLEAALRSPDDRLVLSALELLALQKKQRLVPIEILNYRSPAVLIKALDVLVESGRTDFAASLVPLLSHERADVRAAAVRAHVALGAGPELLQRFADDASPIVRALVSVKLGDQRRLDQMAMGPIDVRVALLQVTSDPELVRRLAASSDPSLLRAASQAIRRLGDPALVPLLVDRLGVGSARHAMRETLVGFGAAAVDALERALEDPATELATRRHLPRTLSRIPTARSVAILARNLGRQPDGVVRYKILLGLGRLAADDRTLLPERVPIVAFAIATARRLHELYAWRTLVVRAHAGEPRRATESGRLIVGILGDKIELGMQRLFRLLALLYPEAKVQEVFVALRSADARARAAALEVLENLFSLDLREWVIPLCDDLPDDKRFERIARRLGAVPRRYEDVLAAMAEATDTLAKITAYHLAELADASAA